MDKISTGVRIITPRGLGEPYLMAKAASPASPTPIAVGEEEITAHLQAVFLLSP